MDYAVTRHQMHQALKAKNIFLGICCVSLGLNVLQVVERVLSSEKIIILPPVITKDVWIKGNTVSEGILEEWALYLTNLLLNVSQNTIGYQSELALRHVSPEFSGKLHKQFKEDARALHKNNASTTFYPKEISVNEKNMTATVTGTFSTYVGKEKISSHEHIYHLQFVFNKGRFLQLKRFKHISKDAADLGKNDLEHNDEKVETVH